MIVLPAPGSSARTNRKRLARQHRLVNGGDLVGQRVDVRGVDGHHRVEQECEVDPLGFARELERGAVAIERKWAFNSGDVDRVLVGASQEAFLDRAVGCPVNELDRALAKFDGRYDRRDLIRLNA